MAGDYSEEVGRRLRHIRRQRGMSLQGVQEASGGKWKAAVVGAYERGQRSVTVSKLAELGEFYGVPPSELLPSDSAAPAPPPPRERRRLTLDLGALERVPEQERSPLARFADSIQVQRGDHGGRVLTIREGDLAPLALVYRTTAEELAQRLAEWGVLVE